MPRRLPLVCPSNARGTAEFFSSPCQGKSCTWWDEKRDLCDAVNTLDDYARWEKPDTELPFCPINNLCRWDVQEIAQGRRGCVPRRLGLVCEHQAGKPGVDPDRAIWGTFNMADPDDVEAWG